MASEEGAIAFLPFLLSLILLLHHFPTSVISAESDNLALPLLSPPTRADDQVPSNIDGGTDLAQSDNLTLPLLSSPDTQTDNVLQNSDINIQMIQSDFHSFPSPPPSEIQKNVSSNSNLRVQKTQSPPPPSKPSNSNLKQQRTESHAHPPEPPIQTEENAPSNSNKEEQRTRSPPPPSKPPTQTQKNVSSSLQSQIQRINSDPHSPPSSSPTQTQNNVPSSSHIEAQKNEESFSTHLEMVTGHDDEIIHTEL